MLIQGRTEKCSCPGRWVPSLVGGEFHTYMLAVLWALSPRIPTATTGRMSPSGTLRRAKALLSGEEKRRLKGWMGPRALPTPGHSGPISQAHSSAITHKEGSLPLTCQPSSHINFTQPSVSWSASALRPRHSLLVAQSCLTLCDPLDCNPPGSSVHGVL